MAGPLEQFGKDLVAAGLVNANELKTLVTSLPPGQRPKHTDALSAILIQQGWLTSYQAEEAAAGRAASLVLGQYVVLDRIGAGGMGQVFKARHRRMERIVAIKLLPPEVNTDPDAVKRFQREVKAAAQLEHPNIVTAYDADEAGGVHFLVMQYVDGCDLANLVRQQGTLPIDTAVDYVLQAARGLTYAHDKKIVHRDIKPGNLLVDRQGTVKVLDLGLARFEQCADGQPDDDELTRSNQMMGTLDYMAPEQACDTHRADARADIYSLGCTLYRLLTGQPLYQGETTMQKLLAHRDQPIPDLRMKCPEAPEVLDALFRRMVAKSVSDRPASMAEVVAELEALHCSHHVPRDENRAVLPQHLRSPASSAPAATASIPLPLPEDTHGSGAPDYATLPSQVRPVSASATRIHRRPRFVAGAVLGSVLVIAGIILMIRRDEPPRVNDGGQTQSLGTTHGPEPARAKAPFDAKQARAYQEAWAEYLGTEVETKNSLGMRMILIPPGEFMMGSTDEQVEELLLKVADEKTKFKIEMERPQRRVAIGPPFLIGSTEVVWSHFQTFVETTKYVTEAERGISTRQKDLTWKEPGYPVGPDLPVTNVTWNDACAFCNWLSDEDQRTPCYKADGVGVGLWSPRPTDIDCQPKRNGNLPAARVRQQSTSLATLVLYWIGMLGLRMWQPWA